MFIETLRKKAKAKAFSFIEKSWALNRVIFGKVIISMQTPLIIEEQTLKSFQQVKTNTTSVTALICACINGNLGAYILWVLPTPIGFVLGIAMLTFSAFLLNEF